MNFQSPSFRRAAGALFAALLPATIALAQDDAAHLKTIQDHVKVRFAAADTDHDGMLTKAEAEKGMPAVAKHFDQIDTAKSGKLSLADVTKFVEKRRAKHAAAKDEPKTEPKKDK